MTYVHIDDTVNNSFYPCLVLIGPDETNNTTYFAFFQESSFANSQIHPIQGLRTDRRIEDIIETAITTIDDYTFFRIENNSTLIRDIKLNKRRIKIGIIYENESAREFWGDLVDTLKQTYN